jgi:hypothetical protein
MMSIEGNLEWLQHRTQEYRTGKDEIGDLVEAWSVMGNWHKDSHR